MLSLKEIRRKLFKGDLTVFFRLFGKDDKTIQPSEVAQIFLNLPAKSFSEFPGEEQDYCVSLS